MSVNLFKNRLLIGLARAEQAAGEVFAAEGVSGLS